MCVCVRLCVSLTLVSVCERETITCQAIVRKLVPGDVILNTSQCTRHSTSQLLHVLMAGTVQEIYLLLIINIYYYY